MANLLDRMIGYVDPKRAAQRAASRRRIELIEDTKRYYEAASGGRNNRSFKARPGTTDSLIQRDGQRLRDLGRDLVRNNAHANKIVTVHADHFVGAGITPRARVNGGDPVKEKVVNDLFEEWSRECHVDGQLDFYGVTYLLARQIVTDGETFVRKRLRRLSDGLAVPLQLQILDSEFCDWSKNGFAPPAIAPAPVQVGETPRPAPQHPIVNGVEYDLIGRRRGYWMFANNPLGVRTTFEPNPSSFVDATEIAHLYEPQSNQVRGVTWFSPIITDLNDLTDYEVAENVRKKTESCMVAIITPGEDSDDSEVPNLGLREPADPEGGDPEARDIDRPLLVDADGNPFERMEPGMIGYTERGATVNFNTPAVSQGIEAYIRTRLRRIAAGGRMPYELLTGDYGSTNFASGKLGLNDYHKFVDFIQWQILIHQGLNPIYGWFIDAAKLAGKIPRTWKVTVEWQPPEVSSIDRLEDAKADLADMRMGKRTPQEVIAKTGRNVTDVLREFDEFFKLVDATGSKLIFDSDPRKVGVNGQLQQSQSDPGNNGDRDAEGSRGGP